MILALVRHGDAAVAQPGEPDAARVLTARGNAQAQALARYLLLRHAPIERILTSPLRRAVETAGPVASAFGRIAEPVPVLASGARPEDLAHALSMIEVARVALVGHAPDLGLLAAFLTAGADSPEIHLDKGGLAIVEAALPFAPGRGKVHEVLDAGEIEGFLGAA